MTNNEDIPGEVFEPPEDVLLDFAGDLEPEDADGNFEDNYNPEDAPDFEKEE